MPVHLVPMNPGPAVPVEIIRPVILIGRHPECDVRLDSPQISRRHCCVAIAYDRLVIRDLGSRNGVRVNGRLVDEVRLVPGDEVAIAQFLYRLESTDPAPEPAPARSVKSRPPSDLPSLVDLDEGLIPLDD